MFISRLDPPDVQNLPGSDPRYYKRIEINRAFFWHAYWNRKEFKKNDKDSRVFKRHLWFWRWNFAIGLAIHSLFYVSTMRGVYSFRNRVLLDMNKVPRVFKIGISATVAVIACRFGWTANLYDYDLYELALRNRRHFDKQFASADSLITSETAQI